MLVPIVLCYGTAAPASVLLHGGHQALTLAGAVGVAWLIVPSSWIERGRSMIGGPSARRETLWASAAVAGSAAAAIVHLLVVPGHLRPEAGPWLAPAFILVAALQGAWAYAVARSLAMASARLAGRLLQAGLLLHGGALTVWALSRTVGLPAQIYPGPPPGVGLPDLAAVAWQLLAITSAVALLRTRPAADRAEPADRPGRTGAGSLTRWSAWPPASRLGAAAAAVSLLVLVPAGGLL